MEIAKLKGVGPKKTAYFKQAGIETSEDLLLHFPRRYLDRSTLVEAGQAAHGEMAVIEATVIDLKILRKPGRKEILILSVESGGRIGEIVFFNASYMKQRFKFQKSYYFYGKMDKQFRTFKMVHPEFADNTDQSFLGIEPVYPALQGITQGNVRTLMRQILSEPVEENLPQSVIDKRKLCDRDYALANMHFPSGRTAYKEAKYRLIFEEFFRFLLGNRLLKEVHRQSQGLSVDAGGQGRCEIVQNLPFDLTDDQKEALSEILEDMAKSGRMTRLLQGDVGCGKTVVAMAAALETVRSGHQVAMMVPTEILALQHYESFKKTLPESVKIALLTGKTKRKNALYKELSDGEIDIVVGTHALIQEGVFFKSLGLVVTDEQHRFGVNQRQKLLSENPKANYLMMSATPIPRTMSMILYSDIDLSTIKTLPKGRQEIITEIGMDDRQIKSLMDRGQQGYVVFPFIEASDHFDQVQSIEEGMADIAKRFKEYQVAVVHGRMDPEERDRVLESFRNGKTNLLVATTVIEVGIDVPNASFIVIHNAERFGLSQLHQLRGRVGRGRHQSYCFLVSADGQEENKRLEILTKSNDGFVISGEDLKLRGPGEVLGIRQHGSNHFLIADFFRHQEIFEKASADVTELLENGTKEQAYLDDYRKELKY